MDGLELDPERITTSEWRELRTELHEWDDSENKIYGFKCLTRYWCREAVFEVHWVAEVIEGKGYSVYLTENLLLSGFKQRLRYQPTLDWKRELARKLGWPARAKDVLIGLSDKE